MGDFNEVFLGNQKNFRGCMESVFFNGIDVMVKAEDAALASNKAKVQFKKINFISGKKLVNYLHVILK